MTEPTGTAVPAQGAGETFEVHRRSWLIIALVVVPLVLAGVYAWFAYDQRSVVMAVVAGLLALLGVVFVPALRDLKAPLLVADVHGIRLQGRDGWVGLLWSEIDSLRVVPGRGTQGAEIRVTANHTPEIYLVPLGLATDGSRDRAEIELARRRDAAPY